MNIRNAFALFVAAAWPASAAATPHFIGPYQGKIHPDDPQASHGFAGNMGTIAVHGRTAVVGARGDDDAATNSGAVYAFAHNGTAWVQHQKLKAQDPHSEDNFGTALDMHGEDLIIVGAPADRTGNVAHGSAYVFAKNENGAWEQQARLVPPDGGHDDRFGDRVAIFGDTAMVSAFGHDGAHDGGAYTDSGAGYVYVNDGDGNWEFTQKIEPADAADHKAFGHSVSLHGTKAIFSSEKSAYFYVYNGSSWVERQQMFAPDEDGANVDRFGVHAKIDKMHGDRFITGAWHDDDRCPSTDNDCQSGSLHLFNYNGNAWVYEAKLLSDVAPKIPGEEFGWTNDIWGDKVVFTLINDDECSVGNDDQCSTGQGAPHCGKVFVFRNDGSGNWVPEEKLAAPDANQDYFGNGVAIYEDTLFVSASHSDDNGLENSGSVYVWGTGEGASSSGGDTDSGGPWVIQYVRLSSDFSNSSVKEISSDFFIGKDREAEVLLLDKDCESNITDIDISTTKDVVPNSTTLDLLSVHHDIDKSSIANSSIWNGTSNELEVCQVVRLVLPAGETGGNGEMVIAEDIRQIKIDFEMIADFNITAGLAAATVSNATATTDVSSFVRAYKCNADDPATEDNSPLGPNQGLSVCVVSNNINEVNVEELVSMTAIQDDANLKIVENGGPFINSLTSIMIIGDGVMVTTRLPITTFTFSNDQSVTIQGEVEMKLANGGARKLRVLVDAGIEGDEKASYDLEVNLQEGDGVAADGAFAMGNSAIAAVALGKAFAFAAALVFFFAA